MVSQINPEECVISSSSVAVKLYYTAELILGQTHTDV